MSRAKDRARTAANPQSQEASATAGPVAGVEKSLQSLAKRNRQYMWLMVSMYASIIAATGVTLYVAFRHVEERFADLNYEARQQLSRMDSLGTTIDSLTESIQQVKTASDEEFELFSQRLNEIDSDVANLWTAAYQRHGDRIARLEKASTELRNFQNSPNAPWIRNDSAIGTLKGEFRQFRDNPAAPWVRNNGAIATLQQEFRGFRDNREAPWIKNANEIAGIREQVQGIRQILDNPRAQWRLNQQSLERLQEALTAIEKRLEALQSAARQEPSPPEQPASSSGTGARSGQE